jgi:hypothetical protein
VNRRSRLVAGAPSSRCLLRRRRLRYRGSLVSRGGRGRAGSEAHELKPSMTAAPVRRISIFIV